jgi:UDP-glucose 4-epimerase
MSRVLIAGGAGPLGCAIAKRLLADPSYDVRISDERQAPQWMREGCEVHRGDLRAAAQATAAIKGCSHVIHMACFEQHSAGDGAGSPHALLEYEGALHNAIIRAALDRGVERFLHVSSPLVFERAELFPTPEEHLDECPAPRSARGFARLSGERHCAAAHREHGLQYSICRPFGAYGPAAVPGVESGVQAGPSLAGPALDLSGLIERAGAGQEPVSIFGSGEQTLTPTHVDDLAEGIIAALGSPAAANEDFNLSAARELSLAEVAQIAWRAGAGGAKAAGAGQAEGPSLKRLPPREIDIRRSCPSATKARKLLGWEARIDAAEGIAALAAAARERAAGRIAAASAGG